MNSNIVLYNTHNRCMNYALNNSDCSSMADLRHKPTDCHINISFDEDDDEEEDDAQASGIALPEVTCLCCYDVLLDPTTLSCGHSFCRHCLAMWVQSSRKSMCPTCRRIWHGFPKVNISFR